MAGEFSKSGMANDGMANAGRMPGKAGGGLALPAWQPCPIRDVLDRIGDQWSLLILEALGRQPVMRFNELGREVEGISRQMLSRTLKRLEQDGFVARTVYAEVPPRVEYALTELGHSFLLPMRALVSWADGHHDRIRDARAAYGERGSA